MVSSTFITAGRSTTETSCSHTSSQEKVTCSIRFDISCIHLPFGCTIMNLYWAPLPVLPISVLHSSTMQSQSGRINLHARCIGFFELSKHLQLLASLLICACVGNFCVCPTLADELCVAFHSCITCNANILRQGQLCTIKVD